MPSGTERRWLPISKLLALGVLTMACSSTAEQAAQTLGMGNAGAGMGGSQAVIGGNAGAAGSASAPAGLAGGESGGGGVAQTAGSGGIAGEHTAGGTAGAAGAGGAAGATIQCELSPTPQVTSGMLQRFDIELTFDGEPFQRGDVVTIGDRELTLSTFLFFLSQASVLQGAQEVPVDLVAADGSIEPYGVHLFDLENPSSYSFHVTAPAGQYDGLKLAVGLPAYCNGGNPADRMTPLNASSPMNWTWGFGYMFLRLEGTTVVPANPQPTPLQIHGGALGAMGTTGEALLSIPGTFSPIPDPIVLRMELKPMLEVAAAETDHLAGGRVLLDALPTLDFLAFTTATFVEP